MASVDDTPIDHNKDYDKGADVDDWLDGRLENAIFNQLMNADNIYKNQAITKLTYFRSNSPSTIFDIDIVDLSDEIINQSELYIKSCKTIEEKYNSLNAIFTRSIFSYYKNSIEPQILSTTKEDKDIVRNSINEISSPVSYKWRLIDQNKKLPLSSRLSELVEYVLPASLSSPLSEEADDKNPEKQNRVSIKNTNRESNNQQQQKEDNTPSQKNIQDTDNQVFEFYIEPALINLKIIKKIGIEKSSNSLIVEACNQIIMQTIYIDDYSDKTIKPLKKQLCEILVKYKKAEDKQNLINSIITCLNSNIAKIFEYGKKTCTSNLSNDTKGDESSKVDTLINLALKKENTERFFKDQNGRIYAAVRSGYDGHLEILAIDSTKYIRYLSRLYRENIGSCISDSSINTVITNLASEAEFDGDVIPLHLRAAWGSDENRSKNGCIYYDMCDILGRIIEISNEGWRIINGCDKDIPIIFKRYNQQAQVEPDRNYPSDIFDKLLNLTNVKNQKHRQLLKVYIISTLIPEIGHVILTTYGPKGSAKSFLLELIKKLVDATKPVLLTLNRNVEQFIQQVNHNYINYYDNVKFIPYWLSDEICKAVTGAGHTKRQLYTNDNDVIYEHRRCLGLNGINVALTEADALDRSISVELEDIDEENRRKEADLWEEFEKLKPKAFAYILDILVKAIQIKSTLNLKRLPRMADFAEWGEAISQAMGYPPMSFIEIYTENRNEQNIVAVTENLVSSILLKYILDIEKETGPITKIKYEPQELYNALLDYMENGNIRIDSRQFPKNAASLVKKIKTVIPNLKTGYGIYIEIGRSVDNTSFITIYRKTTATVVAEVVEINPASSASPLYQHLYASESLRKNLVNHYYYNQHKKSENNYQLDKTRPSECSPNSTTGGTEPPEAISSKSIKDNFQDMDTLDFKSIDSNTGQIDDSTRNLGDKSDKSN